MKKTYQSILLIICFFIHSQTVFATPVRQGPYVGAYMGGAFGSNNISTDVGDVTSSSYFTNSANIDAVNHVGSWTDNPNAVIGGIQVGHDWVWKHMVYGLVLDYGSLTLNSSEKVTETYPDNSGLYTVDISMKTDWLFTLRGKLGYQSSWKWPSFLYVTGGMAMTGVEVNNSFSDNSALEGMGGDSHSQNQIGWTAGLGVEIATFDHVSLGLEYLFVQVPSMKTTSSIANEQAGFGIPSQSLSSPFSTTGKFEANLLKFIVNYRFTE